MKKIISSVVFLFIVCNSFAKINEFSGGFKGGLNFNQITADGWNNNYKTNPVAGIYGYANGYRAGIQVEVMYSNSTLTTDTNANGLFNQYFNNAVDSAKNGSFKFTQIHVPVLFNYKFNRKLWLQMGVQYTANVDVVDKNNVQKTATSIFKNNDVSLVGGLYLKITRHINFSTRYIGSVQNVNDIANSGNKWKLNTIQLCAGFGL